MHFRLPLCLLVTVVSAVAAGPTPLVPVTFKPAVNYEYHGPSELGLRPVTDMNAVKAIHAATQKFLEEAVPHLSIKGNVKMAPIYTNSPHESEDGFIEFLVHFELKTTMCGERGFCVVKMSPDGQNGVVWPSANEHGAGSEGKPLWQKGEVPTE
ncbi:hypothetical protein BDP27DRAFT_1347148 [Rhodocollybia butyracea]|uniref:Uncharacterized protein n=1 Tax=Rhodocollybia butyracea TaxID=206335 RepID=A0A9P5P854_9AGAR|nr:hypothetical protein BDP27DRAFT_1347148 [Rhodocollybia butyracea]